MGKITCLICGNQKIANVKNFAIIPDSNLLSSICNECKGVQIPVQSEPIIQKTYKCSDCGREKPLISDNFSLRGVKSHGLCKLCSKKHMAINISKSKVGNDETKKNVYVYRAQIVDHKIINQIYKCKKCNVEKPLTDEHFSLRNVKVHGLCKPCCRKHGNEKRVADIETEKKRQLEANPPPATRVCVLCMETKPLTDEHFATDWKGTGTFIDKCKVCRKREHYNKVKAETVRNIEEKLAIKTKECIVCHNEKPNTQEYFRKHPSGGYIDECKKCRKIMGNKKIRAIYIKKRELNPNKICGVCKVELPRHVDYFAMHTDFTYYSICRHCSLIRLRQRTRVNRAVIKADPVRYREHRDRMNIISNQRRKTNPEKYRRWMRIYHKDLKWRMKHTRHYDQKMKELYLLSKCRGRLTHILQGTRKEQATKNLLGCDLNVFTKWIEYQFTEGMSWENRSTFHVDHVLPCAQFRPYTPLQQRQCFHWTNLRPLDPRENMSKNNRIVDGLFERQQARAAEFLEAHKEEFGGLYISAYPTTI